MGSAAVGGTAADSSAGTSGDSEPQAARSRNGKNLFIVTLF
jgi:hypothetical protein